jgi:hypothetical protein
MTMAFSIMSIAHRAPHLGDLFEYDYHLRSLLPGHLIVADTPFFIHEDLRLCGDAIEYVRIASKHAPGECVSLRDELRTLARAITQEHYKDWQLTLMDMWVSNATPEIVNVVDRFDMATAYALESAHRLN